MENSLLRFKIDSKTESIASCRVTEGVRLLMPSTEFHPRGCRFQKGYSKTCDATTPVSAGEGIRLEECECVAGVQMEASAHDLKISTDDAHVTHTFHAMCYFQSLTTVGERGSEVTHQDRRDLRVSNQADSGGGKSSPEANPVGCIGDEWGYVNPLQRRCSTENKMEECEKSSPKQ